jgi:ABC transporter
LSWRRPVLLPWLDELANVLLRIRALRRPVATPAGEVRALLRDAGFEAFERRYPRELARGMRSRVALVCALIHAPEMLLMDEPFAAIVAEFGIIEDFAMPSFLAFQSLAKVAISPIVILWFGYGLGSKTAIAAMLALFLMIVDRLEAFTSTESERIDLLWSFRVSRWRIA